MINKASAVVREDQRINLDELAEKLLISHDRAFSNLHNRNIECSVNELMINKASAVVREDQRINLDELAEKLLISHDRAFSNLHNRVCANWVSQFLTPGQKQILVEMCHGIQRLIAEVYESYLQSIATSGESWLHHCDVESKQASTFFKLSNTEGGRSCLMGGKGSGDFLLRLSWNGSST
ncbi:hypothetical protein AVEN_242155-1 [Araneus ventricosus]|uniref:Uncharacterized protein n=1 Tax=Araneus ventricosus TaxID=182803 RepID=A0A4Y2DGF3_ARAVE|nr:hypothetical protein AVEN_242155-1 [Araneus ventricosus]